MILTLYKEKDGKREESIYKIPFVSARHHRTLREYDATIDYSDLTVEQTDELVGFICEVFGNKFTVDEFYDGIPSHELFTTIGDVFYYIRTGKDPAELEGNDEGKS